MEPLRAMPSSVIRSETMERSKSSVSSVVPSGSSLLRCGILNSLPKKRSERMHRVPAGMLSTACLR